MAESQYGFPTEVLSLPSKGLLYPEDSPLRSGTIDVKYMTAKEEDILTSQNLISQGVVIERLLQSCATLDRISKGQQGAEFKNLDWLQMKSLISEFCGITPLKSLMQD